MVLVHLSKGVAHANFDMMRSKAAGNAVKRASDNLVRAAQKAAFDKNEDDSVVVKTKFVGGIAQVRQLHWEHAYCCADALWINTL